MKYNYEFKKYDCKYAPSFFFRYILALPEDYKEGEKLPMIVFLHGAGERGDNIEDVLGYGLPKTMVEYGLNARVIFLAPQIADPTHVWNIHAIETFELINHIADKYNADEDKISLTGISMGGYGTWELGMLYKGYFSALAPICAGGMSWRATELVGTPIRTFHGDADDIVPITASREMVDYIKKVGGDAEFIILHDVDHHSWDFAYEQTNLVEWLVKQDRKDHPHIEPIRLF
ncbi:MAG: hypothetical protein IJD14_02525 [Christensenellaceae bacterium]|nr:hypothetical protein [Christensenellaceae bacterium]